ncbi:MAG: phosphoribosylanthranilate isomerase [Nitrospinae bacterium]|nr:phosphoribosylanthranilate isomerase [Nitrospinota bacterium]
MVKIKICGNTSVEDALLAVGEGADALGFIFYRKSPRFVAEKTVKSIVAQLPPFVETVGVFVDESVERVNRIAQACRLDAVQLHGEESPAYCGKMRKKTIKAFRVKGADVLDALGRYRVAGFLLDAYVEDLPGGTGKTCDWEIVRRAREFGPVILAGGLTPENVAEAARRAGPYGVDVCSGVERSPGKKDPARVRAFIRAARGV